MRVRSSSRSHRPLNVLLTAGPTREYWDPVRFLSNGSSGQMGLALAHTALRLGAKVTLILGPIPGPQPKTHRGLKVIPVVSARDMDREVQRHKGQADVFVGAAAVSDYRPATTSPQKIKGKPASLNLRMVRNPDIIARVAQSRPGRPAVVVGFALETQHMLAHAVDKLKRKRLDWIVANRETNLGSSRGSVTLLSRHGDRVSIGPLPKARLARQLWNVLLDRMSI